MLVFWLLLVEAVALHLVAEEVLVDLFIIQHT
jgi:hypothetical protein